MALTKSAIKRQRRLLILGKTGSACFWCKAGLTLGSMTEDHFVPLGKGGVNAQINVVPACLECNNKRGATMPSEFDWNRLSYITNTPKSVLYRETGALMRMDGLFPRKRKKRRNRKA